MIGINRSAAAVQITLVFSDGLGIFVTATGWANKNTKI